MRTRTIYNPMRVGILFCAYNCRDTVEQSIWPWICAKTQNFTDADVGSTLDADFLRGIEFVISAVSVPFKEYENIKAGSDTTTDFLAHLMPENHDWLDYLFTEPKHISEAEARNLALAALKMENLDYVILWDGDEIPTLQQIASILKYVKLDPWCSWFSISYKNYVFNDKTYLLEAFTPPRIFKVKTNGYIIDTFSWDNDILYKKELDEKVSVEYRNLPTKIIPKSVAWVKHLTWLSNEKTKAKVAYQKEHFKGVCSYRWNDATNALEFDPDFYARRRIGIPETAQEID